MEKQTFEGKAMKVKIEGVDNIAVWTDGVGLSYDLEPYAAFKLEEGKTYRITVEEIKTNNDGS